LTFEGLHPDITAIVVFATLSLEGIPESPTNLWCAVVLSPFAHLLDTPLDV
jgi:hypothetical protein